MIRIAVAVVLYLALLGVTAFPTYLLLGLFRLPHVGRTLISCLVGGTLLVLLTRDFGISQAIAIFLVFAWLIYLGRKKIAGENQGRDGPTSIFK
ncbi:MAG TPA: hypothetical protein VGN86_11065 [Pyrinomonadaceae bacterium]|jgi:hypothetical protein|nr:hypothetical protein [Pyrinomonadaceae bacterium]